MKSKKLFSQLKYDIPASIVVFLVAVPLCLGIALASGAPLYSGMIAGIVGGLVVGTLSDSHVSVSGPAAGLAAIVFVAIQELGSFEAFLLAVVIGGILQVILGFAKAGSIANYFPSSVIKGMLTGIGIIIILKEIPYALGINQDVSGKFHLSQLGNIGEIGNTTAIFITLLSMGLLILWERPFIKNTIRFVPGALVVVIIGLILNQFLLGSDSKLGSEYLVNIPVADSFDSFIGQFTSPDFSRLGEWSIILTGFTIAAVASIESLLCVEAVDKIDPEKRHTNYNRELIAQGIGNITSGLIGGLPVTSVIVRSSANIEAGGRTKMATLMHGALLLICVALIPTIINMIPLAALAAILFLVGYKLAKPALFKSMYNKGLYQFVPFIVTVVAVVGTDLLTGVGIGLATAIFALLFNNLKNSYQFHKEEYQEGDIITIELSQEVSFLNKASIKNTLDSLPENSHVVLDASHTIYIDNDVLELIREFQEVQSKQRNINAVFKGFKDHYQVDNTHLVHSDPANPTAIGQKLIDKANEPSKKIIIN